MTMRFARLLPALLILAACTPGTGTPPTPGASAPAGSPTPASSPPAAGASVAPAPVGADTVSVTLDGQPVTFDAPLQTRYDNGNTLTYMQGTTVDGVEVTFEKAGGFKPPFLMPSPKNSQERRAALYVGSLGYNSDRSGSTEVFDTLVVEDGRIKGTWTYTAAHGDKGETGTVEIKLDVALPAALR